MRPDERELDDEIRGHLALSVQERVERGESPAAARRAALAEFGYIPAMRESMRRVWHSRALDAAAAFGQDIRFGLRSLRRAKGLAATIIVMLALGIGANAAIVSVVSGVLLRPLVNRGEDCLLYLRQSAAGMTTANTTFSVPEIDDLRSRVNSIAAFGEFSTIDFTLVGLSKARLVKAGVVNGAYFEVMGLRPVAGRLLDARDDGPEAAGAAVLTYKFWTTSLESDPSVIGRSIRLGSRSTTIVGVLEPSIPYPADTEIIANIVTSPHHLSATMVTERTHRMTELFGRLAPGASVDDARTELASVYATMTREHPEAYPAAADMRLGVTPLRAQITAPARTILLLLLAAAGVVFVIACSNVANLILARSVRREGELAVRAALGASRGALRRTLLAESLVLCGAGAGLGVLLARPLVAVIAQFASRFSVRALDVTVDSNLLWVGAGLALAAAVLLAYIPRLPSPRRGPAAATAPADPALSGVRMTPSTNRRLRAFATVQIAFSFVLLAGAGTLLVTLLTLQRAPTGFDMRVLAFDLPTSSLGIGDSQEMNFYREVTRRVDQLPGVDGVALGNFVPWRDAGGVTLGFHFTTDERAKGRGVENPYARLRIVAPGFFSVVGVPLIAGRDFTEEDGRGSEPVAIVSQSVAERMFPKSDALTGQVWWTEPLFGTPKPRRIVGVVADVDDEHVEGGERPTIYHPVDQMRVAGRLFVRPSGDPYALVPEVRRVIQDMAAEQPVEHGATLEDVRSEVLAPERLKAFVISGFAAVALLIAVVGVSGVLAFSVSARTREFGVRLAIGASPRRLLVRVLSEGAAIIAIGIVAGAAGAYAFANLAARSFETVRLPGALPMLGAAVVLAGAALLASLLPAARASRVDVLQALRSE